MAARTVRIELGVCGAVVRFAAYENAGHVQSWERAYGDEALCNCFLAHALPAVLSAVRVAGWADVKVDKQ